MSRPHITDQERTFINNLVDGDHIRGKKIFGQFLLKEDQLDMIRGFSISVANATRLNFYKVVKRRLREEINLGERRFTNKFANWAWLFACVANGVWMVEGEQDIQMLEVYDKSGFAHYFTYPVYQRIRRENESYLVSLHKSRIPTDEWLSKIDEMQHNHPVVLRKRQHDPVDIRCHDETLEPDEKEVEHKHAKVHADSEAKDGDEEEIFNWFGLEIDDSFFFVSSSSETFLPPVIT